ncbi:MAG: hypothetical protein LBI53_05900 [Candidatus Peribacteria bacterium]|jgi:hypothetical protein|nr:hypothetical protein [Candidatus Peribacteria bacterium]
MPQSNEIINRIMGRTPIELGGVENSENTAAQQVKKTPLQEEELIPQTRIVTARYKVYAAILLVVIVLLMLEIHPGMKDALASAHNVLSQTKNQLQQLKMTETKYNRDKQFLNEIETNETVIERCLNYVDTDVCDTLPEPWKIELKGKKVPDLSVPLGYLQLNSLYTPKMPVDEKKVLRNLNEYLIKEGFSQSVAARNGDILTIRIGDPVPVKGSLVFFSVPVEVLIEFIRVEDLISFVYNIEKSLIRNSNDRIRYKIQEVSYDIVTENQPQQTQIKMLAHYYHDPRFDTLPQQIDSSEAEAN